QGRVVVLAWQAMHAWQGGDYARARSIVDTCLPLAERLTNPVPLQFAWNALGLVATEQGDPAAGSYVAQALALARTGGAARMQLVDIVALAGMHALWAERPEEAVAHAVEGLQLADALGSRLPGPGVLHCLTVLACAWTAQGRLPEPSARLL